jgi:anthraniloyl-CoA monooxygenase
LKVLCVGGGPGGLYTATQLAVDGHDVTVAERNPEGVTDGWGVAGSELRRTVEASDAETSRQISENVETVRGQTLDHPSGSVVSPHGGGHSIGRHTLISVLAERATELGVTVEYEREVDWDQLLHDPDRVDGWDLVVASDGANSRFREGHTTELGTSSRTGRNYFVWLGTTKEFGPFTFGFVRTRHGWLWAHAYRHDTGLSTVTVECPPETWHAMGFDAMGAREALAVLEWTFAEQLDGHPLLIQDRDAERDTMPWRRHKAVRNEHWRHGRVALLGDAAHTTHFSIGSGTRLAFEDAQALARSLAHHDGSPDRVPDALAEYESRRRAAVRLAQRDADYSALWLEQIHRFTNLDADRFAALFDCRLSPFLAKLPPKPYHLVRHTIQENDTLRAAWRRANAIRRGRFVSRHTC